ncbi:MAG: hypothetical protein E2591_20890 [Achromobacter sp.]|uniref:hypothetical protein n=1 Tax=Achromobacter sp. TaxID=134375 RepID=UPI0012D0FAF7|nr:hypothetical protein [Achromobacter sp.]MPS80533.1 hypothetical protein [Achromobacter sp.]
MKNASNAYRGAPMPGGRSFTQFRAARIRRVVFQWNRVVHGQGQSADDADSGTAKDDPVTPS